MKHVREDVPDVQARRPEISAATASVLDRALAKDLSRRYPDAPAMVADLENVLAIEASRTGQTTGEVTTSCARLRGRARRRLPWRMRHPVRWLVSLAVVCAIVAVVILLAANGAQRGTGAPPGARRSPASAEPLRVRGQRLQPVRHRARKPRPDRQRRRQRPFNDVDHRDLLRRQPAQAGRHGPRDLPRRGTRRRRSRDRDPDPDTRLRRAVLRLRPHRPGASLWQLGAAVRAWLGRPDRLEPSCARSGQRSPCTRRPARTATTSCG